MSVSEVVSLFRAAMWVVLAFLQWRIARRLYPTSQAVHTIIALVFLALGVGAAIRALGTTYMYDAWVIVALTPVMVGAAIVSYAAWRARKL